MEKRLNLAGWILFLICAGFFIGASVKAGDTLYLVGSLIFLFACILFIIPFIIKRAKTRDE
jgi:membrane protein DedA with SNARE-associated domain